MLVCIQADCKQENSSNLGSGVTGKVDRQIYMTSNQYISGKI
jgi:hypothetical protein